MPDIQLQYTCIFIVNKLDGGIYKPCDHFDMYKTVLSPCTMMLTLYYSVVCWHLISFSQWPKTCEPITNPAEFPYSLLIGCNAPLLTNKHLSSKSFPFRFDPCFYLGNGWFAQSTIRAREPNIHRIARMISYIARIIRWSEVNVITLSSVHRFNKAGDRCSTKLAPLKCWGVEMVDFDLRVIMPTSSATTIYIIPSGYHLVTCSNSYIWQNLCWGNCKYVNKMHFIKWHTNRMLSSYINNNRLFNFT